MVLDVVVQPVSPAQTLCHILCFNSELWCSPWYDVCLPFLTSATAVSRISTCTSDKMSYNVADSPSRGSETFGPITLV